MAATLLRQEGWDAIHVSEVQMSSAPDSDILEFARRTNRVCVTLDHDFHAHLATTKSERPSVILLRVQGLTAKTLAAILQRVWESCEVAIEAEAAVTANSRAVRVRNLPLR